MNIAEFFVNLGIKGDDKTNKALKSVDVSLRDMGSNALWAKAGIIGAMWGLERMMSNSNAAGAGMVNFAAATGLSMQSLQEWKYAAQQVNVAGGDVESSLKGVQNTMMNMLQGKGQPAGLAMFADFLAKSGEAFDETKVRDMDYMLTRLQKFSQSGPADLLKDKVMSFGVSESMFGAMRQNAFRPDVMKNAPKYSDREAKDLSKMQASWANIGQKFEMGLGHLFAKHGPQFVKDIDIIIPKVMRLVEALVNLADRVKIFKVIGMAFEGWSMILDKVNESIDSAGDNNDDKKKLDNKGFSLDPEVWAERWAKMRDPSLIKLDAAPKDKVVKHTTVNQNMNFTHPGVDPKKTASSVAKATKQVVQTSHAQAQEN